MNEKAVSRLYPEKKSMITAKTVSICFGLLTVVFIALSVFRVPVGTLFFAGALLACPLLHIFMMKDGGHKH